MAALGDLGVVRMMEDFWRLSAEHPSAAFIGTGPANYGSPAALTRVDKGEAAPEVEELFWREVASERELIATGELLLLGLSAKTSILGVLLGEYGCLALIVFLYLLVWPLTLVAGAEADGDLDTRHRLFWLKMAYLAVVVQACISTLGAWDNDPAITVLMVGFAGLLGASRANSH